MLSNACSGDVRKLIYSERCHLPANQYRTDWPPPYFHVRCEEHRRLCACLMQTQKQSVAFVVWFCAVCLRHSPFLPKVSLKVMNWCIARHQKSPKVQHHRSSSYHRRHAALQRLSEIPVYHKGNNTASSLQPRPPPASAETSHFRPTNMVQWLAEDLRTPRGPSARWRSAATPSVATLRPSQNY